MSSKLIALDILAVPIDANCVGDRWRAKNLNQLGKLIAIVAMGQAQHAAQIISSLKDAAPVFSHDTLIREAKLQLTIGGATEAARRSSRWRRDGFIFETISWIAAQQTKTTTTLLKDPHIKSTTQGIDGLVIEMDATGTAIQRATVVEDKCSEDPRDTFRYKVMPSFAGHHRNTRGPELVSTAAGLIAATGMNGSEATAAAARVLDLAFRRYLAALAIENGDDNQAGRAAIFAGYDALGDIAPSQRHASTFVVKGALRDYLDTLAETAISALDSWPEEASV